MTSLSEDAEAQTRLSASARKLAQLGSDAEAPGPAGLRGLARRAVLRAIKPHSTFQQQLDGELIDAVDQLDARLRALEHLELAALTEDLLGALDTLRGRVDDAEEVVAGARALPYMAAGALEQFDDPFAGVVLGYREKDPQATLSYAAFEDVFRGPEERVRDHQGVYLDLLAPHAPVFDAGCGRGELLDLLRQRGVESMGADPDSTMVERCQAKGHSVTLGTAEDRLDELGEASVGAVFSAQVIEHMPYAALARFMRVALRALRPGGLFVAETVNPHAPHALKTFWVDPTHQHPLFPEVTVTLCRLAGFASAYVFHPHGTGHVEDDRYRESEYAVVATKSL
jgi:SAM-dependent methyltransferase